jgi:hypothetical protein
MSSPRKVRRQILMPADLKRRAQDKAARQGISLAEYVRRVIAQDLGPPKRGPAESAGKRHSPL